MAKKCLIPHEEQKMERCLWCNAKINPSFTEKLKAEVDAVPLETKQRILDLLHDGKNIGQVCDDTGLSTLIVGEIILRNIHEVKFLGREAR